MELHRGGGGWAMGTALAGTSGPISARFGPAWGWPLVLAVGVGGVLLASTGCGGATACLPGSAQSCQGANGCVGEQRCLAEVEVWGSCACPADLITGGAGSANPCLVENGGCDPEALCSPVPGGRTCTCPVQEATEGPRCRLGPPRRDGPPPSPW